MITRRAIGRTRSAALRVALIALMCASLSAVKAALMLLPNIEAVTLLTALYGYIFGWMGVVAAALFVGLETLLWGWGSWVIGYLLYWPMVAALFWLLAKLRVKNRLLLTLIAAISTVWFGVLTSLIDVGLFSGFWDNYWQRFSIYYARGVYFYIAQIVCNIVLFITAFTPLRNVLAKLYTRMGGRPVGTPPKPLEPADLPEG